MVMTAIRAGMINHFGLTTLDDDDLVAELPAFITNIRTRLPRIYWCYRTDALELRSELRDAILYGQGPATRVQVETSRLFSTGSR